MIDYKVFTIGIEEEYMVIDPTSKELISHEQQIVTEGQKIFKDKVKAEMHQAVVEVGTDICSNIENARKDITHLRKTIKDIATLKGFSVGAAGTHPFSTWRKQLITDHERYKEIVNEMQDAARSNLIFGLHVHVGMPSKEMAIHIANAARYFLPHVFALSTNSPFWERRNTGFKSYRTKVFDKFPRTGIPDYFDSYSAYENYVNLLIKTNCIDNAKKIWWDLRVHPFYGTVEFRVCDVPLTVDESVAFAALFQCICAKLFKLRLSNLTFMIYPRALVNENKWRASRYGIDDKLIDFGIEKEVPTKDLIMELLDFVDDVVDELGCRTELKTIEKIIQKGTGADRQLEAYKVKQDHESVAAFIESNFLANL
ncbi:MAG: carboxylate-amine ligase [Chitinophagaceae bacterium]